MTIESMFMVKKTDHPDLVGGIVWSNCELDWINERITMAILTEREACAMVCDNYEPLGMKEGPQTVAYEIALEIRARKEET
jgi:hypothetical protein